MKHPEKLVLLHVERGTMIDEAKIHKHFSDLRIRGEWFRLQGKLSTYIRKAHKLADQIRNSHPLQKNHDALAQKELFEIQQLTEA